MYLPCQKKKKRQTNPPSEGVPSCGPAPLFAEKTVKVQEAGRQSVTAGRADPLKTYLLQ